MPVLDYKLDNRTLSLEMPTLDAISEYEALTGACTIKDTLLSRKLSMSQAKALFKAVVRDQHADKFKGKGKDADKVLDDAIRGEPSPNDIWIAATRLLNSLLDLDGFEVDFKKNLSHKSFKIKSKVYALRPSVGLLCDIEDACTLNVFELCDSNCFNVSAAQIKMAVALAIQGKDSNFDADSLNDISIFRLWHCLASLFFEAISAAPEPQGEGEEAELKTEAGEPAHAKKK